MIKIQECSSVDAFSGCNGTGGLLDTAVSAITGDAKFCDTSKSWRRVLIWIQWNGKKWAIQFYSCESCPNPLNFIIAWFSTSKEYWVSGPFFCFVSKGSNQFETQLGFTRRLKVNQALDILSGKKRRRFLYLWSSLWSWRTFDSTLGINAVTLPKNKNKAYLCIRSKAY